jgi:hypothetical protein
MRTHHTHTRALACLLTPAASFPLAATLLLTACGAGSADDAAERTDEAATLAATDLPARLERRGVPDPTGTLATVDACGAHGRPNAFFESLGTNGRACVTCHEPTDAWSVTPPHVRARFQATRGLDPIFRLDDGATNPSANVSTATARAKAYALLLNKGLIRVHLPIPRGAEFELFATDDPYGNDTSHELSMFRRPLPATNLAFDAAVMWDGREPDPRRATLLGSLEHQANDATVVHADATRPLTSGEREAIATCERGSFTAQTSDARAGDLASAGALGGPAHLSRQPFAFGMNDPFGGNPTHAHFNPKIFSLYDGWSRPDTAPGAMARHAIARGQAIFNTKVITIYGVKGLNDDHDVNAFNGTCGTCHDTPNVGSESLPRFFDIGVADLSRRTPDMPLYVLLNRTTSESVVTTDPGRAMVTGRWKDVSRFKVPGLRGLAGRAPYFHDGSAATLADVVTFYDGRFQIGYSAQERSDLVAFLAAL